MHTSPRSIRIIPLCLPQHVPQLAPVDGVAVSASVPRLFQGALRRISRCDLGHEFRQVTSKTGDRVIGAGVVAVARPEHEPFVKVFAPHMLQPVCTIAGGVVALAP